jgi:hypothetical protein
LPEEVYFSGDGLKLSLSIAAKGQFLDSDEVERFFKEKYEDDDIELSQESEAIIEATYVFQIAEVFDDLIPTSSKVILCRGTCEIKIVYEDEEILKHTLHSKVISGKDRKEAHQIITDYLKKSAYQESVKALDEVIYE